MPEQELQDKFNDVICACADEVIAEEPLDRVRKKLLITWKNAFGKNMQTEIEKINKKEDIAAFLHKFCYLTNIVLLKLFVKLLHLLQSEEMLNELEVACDSYYNSTLAVDLAKQRYEDHPTLDHHKEVIF